MSTARALTPTRRVAAALAAAALAAVGVVAADVPAVTTAHSAPTASVLEAATTGTVERVAGGVLVLRDAAGDLQRLVLAAGATVVRDGQEVALTELALGDRVTA